MPKAFSGLHRCKAYGFIVIYIYFKLVCIINPSTLVVNHFLSSGASLGRDLNYVRIHVL